MNLIGNDIVDLKSPEATGKSRDVRFISRTFNARERDFIFNSSNPDTMLWALWSAKESAYKAVSKSDPAVSSAPGKYPVQPDALTPAGIASGKVGSPAGPVQVKIDFCPEYVHCVGIFGPKAMFSSFLYGVEPIGSANMPEKKSISEIESRAVRQLATKEIAAFLHVPAQDIFIIRQKKEHVLLPPEVHVKNHPTPADISLSHDGRYAAYAFLPDSSGYKRETGGGPGYYLHR